MMPNAIAQLALLLWPALAAVLYARLSALTATFITIIGGYLFLPVKVEFDLPLLPPLDQESIPVICAAIGCLVARGTGFIGIPVRGLERIIVIVLLLSPVATVMTNGEPYFDGEIFIRGLAIKDSLTAIAETYLMLLPFVLGLALVKTDEDLIKVFRLLVFFGLAYTPLVLYEARMSPQLHTMVYGFFPHSFAQQVRFGGFRPVVFVGHGLLLALFFTVPFLASAVLSRARQRITALPNVLVTLYLALILVVCKSVAAWLIGFIGFCSIMLMPQFLTRLLIRLICVTVIAYPLLCIMDLFPHQEFVEFAALFGEGRAQSLDFRFYHEERLLEHAREKILLGWGAWGRNRLSDSVTDGFWIIQLGCYGLIMFAGLFGLMSCSVFRALGIAGKSSENDRRALYTGAALVAALMMMNQLPNSSLYSWLWFLFGCIGGVSYNRVWVVGHRERQVPGTAPAGRSQQGALQL
ncbi:hypothetical protein [Microbulbifer sp. YPW16]|uniref:hypothetical protein n=1 Tax=Microbulbifer sp. YPW16 TaxID=2904242 RepID=UPI001E390D93|nr:hypothetical protein [Microbulbifer sp. YPW16]UHQ54109.1 hypothetical protein LVE68_11330 [Microbulbifer sp. YPW16]